MKNIRAFLSSIPSAPTGTVILLTRLIVGYGFLQHGFAKVLNGPANFAASLAALGVPLPQIMSWVTIVSELACGAAVLLGLFVPLILIPMAIILIVALLYVHLPFGFSSIKLQAVTADGIKFGPPGYEVIMLYLNLLWCLAVLGPGPLSLDTWLSKRLRTQIS